MLYLINFTSPDLFDDCNSGTRTFGAWNGTGDENAAFSCYVSDTQIRLYVGSNYYQVVFIGWY